MLPLISSELTCIGCLEHYEPFIKLAIPIALSNTDVL